MSFFFTPDSFRLAAALLARASTGSGLTALVLLVLVGTTGLGTASAQTPARDAATIGHVEGGVAAQACARAARPRPSRVRRARRPALSLQHRVRPVRTVADGTLQPARAP